MIYVPSDLRKQANDGGSSSVVFATGGGTRHEVCQHKSGSSTHILAYAARISSYFYPMRRVMGSNNVTTLHSFHSHEYGTVRLQLQSEVQKKTIKVAVLQTREVSPPPQFSSPTSRLFRKRIYREMLRSLYNGTGHL